MASEKMGMVPPQQIHNGLSQHPHPQLVYPEFGSGPQAPHRRSADPCPKSATRELTASFLDHQHYFHNHHQAPPPQPQTQTTEFRHQWANSRSSATPSGGDATEDDDVDDDDDVDNDDDDDDGQDMVTVAKVNETDSENFVTNNNSQKMKQLSALGNTMEIVNGESNDNNKSGGRSIGEEVYYAQYLHGSEGPSSSSGQKDSAVVENESGSSRRKESCYPSESQESLRTILSDPITGALMDDAMILSCGHSFGGGGMQQITRMKACYTCSQSVSEDSIAPNLSLRLAVQAFRREQELQVNQSSKRRRAYDPDKGTCDSALTEPSRGRGVQFPFVVTDRVIIKGNKRTPQRFVGRVAIVTTQCLNGWYVVKTLDNAESVKLQYRSLAKVADNPSSNPLPVKMTPNWL